MADHGSGWDPDRFGIKVGCKDLRRTGSRHCCQLVGNFMPTRVTRSPSIAITTSCTGPTDTVSPTTGWPR
ncbi:conserved hypothetical protein [Ricinus communis]|uniref:Uncharacterized protein n=1 Tax=Ricinus communis TaxID=3988 RepID=B9TCU4_RICCO|nr:conserved hypothetical protein [Ricinus communis]